VPYPAITERYGSLSATGFAEETSFGVPVPARTWLPMLSNSMEADPGWASPGLMMGLRDKQVFNIYGEAKYAGTITGPLFPSNAIVLLEAAIGDDSTPGLGVTGTPGSGSTTLYAGADPGTVILVGSVAGFSAGQVIQVDVNGTGPTTTAECVTIAAIGGPVTSLGAVLSPGLSGLPFAATLLGQGSGPPYVITLASPGLTMPHLAGAPVTGVTAPFTHVIAQQNVLDSLTVEKVIGGYQSLQFAGCRVNKLSVKAPVGNSPVELGADMIGQSVLPMDTPTAITVTNELPFVFAEASLSLDGGARAEVTNLTLDIENGVKETYSWSGQHGPGFLTPVTVRASGTIDVVWSSLNAAIYGDFTTMVNGTLGALSAVFAHPGGYSVAFSLPQVALSKYANDVKLEDVVMSSLTFEASDQISTGYTVRSTVINGVPGPY
jgi:tail tube protein